MQRSKGSKGRVPWRGLGQSPRVFIHKEVTMDWLLQNAALMGLIVSTARGAQVPPELVLGIIEAESGGDPHATKINATYPYTMMQAKRPAGCSVDMERMCQKTAWGLMQVMGATARELGFDGWLSELVNPETNVRLGIEFLGRKMSQYFERDGIEGVVAAYNGGAPRRRPDGKFTNQGYVDRVMEAAKRFEATVSKFETLETSPVARTERKKRKSGTAEETPPSGEAETEDRADGE